MSRCANSHEPDVTCADCDPEKRPAMPDRPDPILPPVDRDRALEHVHQLKDQLAHVDGPPALDDDQDDNTETAEHDEETDQ